MNQHNITKQNSTERACTDPSYYCPAGSGYPIPGFAFLHLKFK